MGRTTHSRAGKIKFHENVVFHSFLDVAGKLEFPPQRKFSEIHKGSLFLVGVFILYRVVTFVHHGEQRGEHVLPRADRRGIGELVESLL